MDEIPEVSQGDPSVPSEAVGDPSLRMEVEMTPHVVPGMTARAKGCDPAIVLLIAVKVA